MRPLESLREPGAVTPTQAFLRENIAIARAVRAAFGGTRPDLVLYDEAAFQAGRALARTWGVPAAQLAPSVMSNAHYSYLGRMFEYLGRMFELVPGLVMEDPVDEIEEFLDEFGLTGQTEDFRWTRRGGEDLNVVFVPRWFQPAHETFDDRYVYVGLSLGNREFLGEWTPPASGLPVVLVSLGTVNNRHLAIFRTAVEAFRGQPWHGVISVGNGLDPAVFGEVPDNIEIGRWFPHVDVLEHAVAFVTHGGTGSLAEALHTATPVVVVPPGPEVLPYTERVLELGVGTAIRPEDLDVRGLRAAVRTVTEDEQIRRRVDDLHRHARAAGGAPRAADVLEAYLTRTRVAG